jgi:Bacillus phage endonuclease
MAKSKRSGAAAAARGATKRKRCRDCRRRTQLDHMKRAAGGRSGSICRKCDRKRARARYWADVKASRRRERQKYWRNPEHSRRLKRDLRRRFPERYKAQGRAAWRRHLEKNRARGRRNARSQRGREGNRKAVAHWQRAHPRAVAAHRALQAAVRRGEVIRPKVCQAVGCRRRAWLSGHHRDYRRPLDVDHLCNRCHEMLHHRRRTLRLKRGAKRKFATRGSGVARRPRRTRAHPQVRQSRRAGCRSATTRSERRSS